MSHLGASLERRSGRKPLLLNEGMCMRHGCDVTAIFVRRTAGDQLWCLEYEEAGMCLRDDETGGSRYMIHSRASQSDEPWGSSQCLRFLCPYNIISRSVNQSVFISGRSPLNKQQRKSKHGKPDRTDTQENTGKKNLVWLSVSTERSRQPHDKRV